MADHEGCVGIEDYEVKFSKINPQHMYSIFSSLVAIKCNG